MLEIALSPQTTLVLEFLVLDVNGTIALDGHLVPGVRDRLEQLRDRMDIWLVSADTQGTLAEIAADLRVKTRLLRSGDEVAQKAALVEELGAVRVVAVGNGANDQAMLRRAALGIAVLGDEGLATACLDDADLVAANILAALDLLLHPRRLVATLRM